MRLHLKPFYPLEINGIIDSLYTEEYHFKHMGANLSTYTNYCAL